MLRIFMFMAVALVLLGLLQKSFTGRPLTASSIASGFEQIGEKAWNTIKGIGK